MACVDAIESIDSALLVQKIDSRLDRELPIFIEVNVSGEDTKHGCSPTDVPALIEAVSSSAHLSLAGFMTVGLNSSAETDVRRGYAQLRQLRDRSAKSLTSPQTPLSCRWG